MKLTNLVKTAVFCSAGFLASATYADDFQMSYKADQLNSMQGISEVHKEILQTAKDHCPTYRQIRSHSDVRACQNDVVNSLLSQIDSRQLTAYHNGESYQPVAGL